MTDTDDDRAFQAAYQCHLAGRLADAEAGYRRLLGRTPTHARSLHYLGLVAQQFGHADAAIDLIRRAIAVRPDYAEAYSNLGNVLQAAGQLQAAIEAQRRAVALCPTFAEGHCNLGAALADDRQHAAAIAAYDRAIALRPNYPEAHNNLGLALAATGRPADGIAGFRRAVELRPDYADAHRHLGNTLRSVGDADGAVAALTRAVAAGPASADAQFDLGVALLAAGRPADAVEALGRAVALRPDDPATHTMLGDALVTAWRPEEAEAAFRRAIAVRPDYAEAHAGLGNAVKDQGRAAAAVDAYRRAVAARPDFWQADSNLVYTLHFDPAYDAAHIADEHRRWARQHAGPSRPPPTFPNGRDPDRRLRVGYVSPDFRDHVVGRNLLPLFERHDHARFEVTCYSQRPDADAMTARFRAAADRWRDEWQWNDDQLVERIRADEIDVLVDLTVHMAGHRLLAFARRPAPVQVTFAGYPGGTGLDAVDYRLSDPYLDPPGADGSAYAERVVRLPHSFWCYDPHDGRDAAEGPLPAVANGHVTFGCLNNLCKVNDDVLRLWGRVLVAVPGSRMLVAAAEGSHRRRVADRLAESGVAADRVGYVGRLSHRAYLEQYRRIDLGLDTFPYNGHTTSLDGLWMGVPTVTLVGRTAVGRAGLSQLSNIGLPEFIAPTPDEFVRIATAAAGDLPRLATVRATLRDRMTRSPLMDADGFARAIEAAYRQMWRAWTFGRVRLGTSEGTSPAVFEA